VRYFPGYSPARIDQSVKNAFRYALVQVHYGDLRDRVALVKEPGGFYVDYSKFQKIGIMGVER